VSAYATATDVTARIADASGVDAAIMSVALDDAAAEISLEAYGERALQAHVFLTAHLIACRTGGLGGLGGGGPISAKSFGGGMSVSYAAAVPMDPSTLAQTVWGREYMRIRDSIIAYPMAL